MSITFNYPFVSWGTPDNLAGDWGTTGATVTGSIASPYGDTLGWTVTNNSGGGSVGLRKQIVYSRSGYQEASLFLKSGSATDTELGFFDTTTSTWNYRVQFAWSGGAPTGSTQAGSGGFYSPAPVGSDWWFIRFFTNTTVAGNSNWFYFYPSGVGAVAGSTSIYVKNAVLSGSPLYQSVADDQPMDGSVFAQAPSGVEDSWVIGTDERLKGQLRWIPAKMTDTPAKYSGFYGLNESGGINVGFKKMLSVGRAKTLLRFSPDSSNIANYKDSYLYDASMQDSVTLEEDGSRNIALCLRNPNLLPYEGY